MKAALAPPPLNQGIGDQRRPVDHLSYFAERDTGLRRGTFDPFQKGTFGLGMVCQNLEGGDPLRVLKRNIGDVPPMPTPTRMLEVRMDQTLLINWLAVKEI